MSRRKRRFHRPTSTTRTGSWFSVTAEAPRPVLEEVRSDGPQGPRRVDDALDAAVADPLRPGPRDEALGHEPVRPSVEAGRAVDLPVDHHPGRGAPRSRPGPRRAPPAPARTGTRRCR